MAKHLQEWLSEDVGEMRDRPVSWLSSEHFFRDPIRPTYSDTAYFFAPADGLILYQETVEPDEPILDIKGAPYSLRDAMRDPHFDRPSLVIGIFMTFFDVHVNRVPYPGRLSWRLLEPIDTLNHPMLDVETSIMEDLHATGAGAEYLRHNQRVINRVDSVQLGQEYYMLQIADYDVDSITPFELRQNQPCRQGKRFSQIRYGSQVDLVIPLSRHFDFEPLQPTQHHVEAGLDPLVAVRPKQSNRRFIRNHEEN
jgi:phosphatidylserine decarboxylase